MGKVIAPKSLNTAQKRAFGRLAQQLSERGIDPADRADLIADFITIGDRLDALRRQEIGSAGPERVALARAITTAQVERRRVRDRLWQGARPGGMVPTPAEAAAADHQAEADRLWRAMYDGTFRSTLHALPTAERDAAWKRREAELEARFGPPSWSALVDVKSARYLDEQNRQDAERRAAGLPDAVDEAWDGR